MNNHLTIKDMNIICTIDNAGSIGLKENDTITAPYDVLSYLTFRNALMENLSKHTVLKAVLVSTFCGDEYFDQIQKGLDDIFDEINLTVPVLYSSESNFEMKESALSVSVIGEKKPVVSKSFSNYAVVGKPYIGDDVLTKSDVISLSEFIELLGNEEVSKVIPIGSKGIKQRVFQSVGVDVESTEVDLYKSAGPSTCIVIEHSDKLTVSKNIKDKMVTLQVK